MSFSTTSETSQTSNTSNPTQKRMKQNTDVEKLDEYMNKYCGIWPTDRSWLGEKCIWAGGSLTTALMERPLDIISDIDLWIFDATLMANILSKLNELYGSSAYYISCGGVITVFIDRAHPTPTIPIQLIFVGEHRNPLEVIQYFDMTHVMVYSRGDQIITTPEYLEAISSGVTKCRKNVRSTRVEKAKMRGFQVDLCGFHEEPSSKTLFDYFYPTSQSSDETRAYNLHMLRTVYKNWTVYESFEQVPTAFKPITSQHPYAMTSVSTNTPLEILSTDSISKVSISLDKPSEAIVKLYFINPIQEIKLANVTIPFEIKEPVFNKPKPKPLSPDGINEFEIHDPSANKNCRVALSGFGDNDAELFKQVDAHVEKLFATENKFVQYQPLVRQWHQVKFTSCNINQDTKIRNGDTNEVVSMETFKDMIMNTLRVNATVRIQGGYYVKSTRSDTKPFPNNVMMTGITPYIAELTFFKK